MTIEVTSPSFNSPTEVFAHLFECGVEPSDCRVEQGPAGTWRGKGTVKVRKHADRPRR
jgi:hypothetical protein